MLHCVVWYISTDTSEKLTASVISTMFIVLMINYFELHGANIPEGSHLEAVYICHTLHGLPTYQIPPHTWRWYERNQPLPCVTIFSGRLPSSVALFHVLSVRSFLGAQFSGKYTHYKKLNVTDKQLLQK